MSRIVTLLAVLALAMLPASVINAGTPPDKAGQQKERRISLPIFSKKIETDPSVMKRPVGQTDVRNRPISMFTSSKNNIAGFTEDLYGYLGYYNDPDYLYNDLGWNIVNIDGSRELVWNCSWAMMNMPLQAMWIRDGRLCGYSMMQFFGEIVGLLYREHDLATGEKLLEQAFEDTDKLFITAAYMPASGEIYGYAYNADVSGYNFVKAKVDDPVNTTEIIRADVANERCMSLTYNEYNDMIYGVNLNGDFVEIDCLGNQRILMESPMGPIDNYITGLTYSPSRHFYIYNLWQDGVSSLVTLYPDRNKVETIAELTGNEEYFSFFSNDVDLKALERPEIKNITFQGAEKSGSITWLIPYVNVGGESVSGTIDYKATVDGIEVISGSTTAGSEINVNFDDIPDGNHTFSLNTYIDGNPGKRSNVIRHIGYDIPQSPLIIGFDENSISWEPVTTGIYGGFIDNDDLKYQVWVDDILVATTSDNSVPTGLDSNELVSLHHAKVIAVCHGKESDPAVAEPYIYGKAYTPDVTFVPTPKENEIFRVIDANSDTYIWYYDEEVGAWGYTWEYTTEPNNYDNVLLPGDDWLILPPVMFDNPTKVYEFALLASGRDTSYLENFEIRIGEKSEIDSMDRVLFESGDIASDSFASYETYFSVNNPGVKYIAVRALSGEYHHGLFVKEFRIGEAGDIEGPSIPEIKSVAPGSCGTLTADVEFVMPTKTFNGKDIHSDMVLTAIVEGADTVSVTGTPGTIFKTTVKAIQGNNRFSVRCNDSDNKKGCPAFADAFVGFDTPKAPENLRFVTNEDNHTIHMCWTPSEEGIHGGYVDQTKITYYITPGGYFHLDGAVELGTAISEYDYVLPYGSELNDYWFAIAAVDTYGNYDGFSVSMAQAGKPLSLPILEDFEDMSVHYGPLGGTEEDSSSYLWALQYLESFFEEYINEKGYALLRNSYEMEPIWLALPKFSTEGVTVPSLKLSSYCGGGANDIEVYVRTYGMAERVFIGKATGEGWTENTFVLPAEFIDKKWVEIDLKCIPSEPFGAAFIDGYEIKDYKNQDFKVCSMSTDSRLVVGNESTISVVIQNNGREEMAVPEMECSVNKRNIKLTASLDTELPASIKSGEKVSLNYSFVPSADLIGSVTAKFEFLTSDEDSSNDTAKSMVTVVSARTNVVTDLSAKTDDGTQLIWSAPLSQNPVGFEEEVAGQLSAELSTFINIDGDGIPGFASYIPTPHVGEAYGWIVWNQIDIEDICYYLGEQNIFYAGKGLNSAVAFCPEDGTQADDWLISPMVKGGSDISFMMKPASTQYGEEIVEILVSGTDEKRESFTMIGEAKSDLGSWQTFEFKLPSDAKYFALRYVSANVFGVFLDEIQFTPDSSEIDYYEVYRDGEVIATSIETGYKDTTASDGSHTYNVVPVMKDGSKGLISNTITVATSSVDSIDAEVGIIGTHGQILFIGLEGCEITVYSLDGMSVAHFVPASDHDSIMLQNGVYIVRYDKSLTKKVIVK